MVSATIPLIRNTYSIVTDLPWPEAITWAHSIG
jgi:hypothetical protein